MGAGTGGGGGGKLFHHMGTKAMLYRVYMPIALGPVASLPALTPRVCLNAVGARMREGRL